MYAWPKVLLPVGMCGTTRHKQLAGSYDADATSLRIPRIFHNLNAVEHLLVFEINVVFTQNGDDQRSVK